MRATVLALLAATTLSSAAFAQIPANSPFGPPSAPLTQEELDGIKAESAARKAAIRKAREAREERARAKREAEEAAAASEVTVEKEKAVDSTSAPAPVSTPAVIDAAPEPAGATTDDTTTVIQPGSTTTTTTVVPASDPLNPAPTVVIVPTPAPAATMMPAPAADPLNPGPEPTTGNPPPTSMELPGAGSSGGR